ncbi:MAG TPA: hypothetical protein VGQ78_04570 [Vicinamibacteria bacterium]|nr:hypothetical protein [Vicinamibacteria bacterium]
MAAFILAPFFYWHGGVLETEATQFIPHYLDGRSLVQKVFDPRNNDFGAYQARELSYLLDWIDARFFDALLARGAVVFVPLSVVLSTALAAGVFHAGRRRVMPRVDPIAAALVLLLYLSGFTFLVTAGVYYRSGKAWTVPILLALLFTLLHSVRDESAGRRAFAVVLILSLVASLLDRQGFFLVLVALVVTGAWAWRRPAARSTAAALAVSAALAEFYNRWLAPAIVNRVNGYWPRFKYQDISPWAPLRKPVRLREAVEVMGDSVSMVFGSPPAWACGALSAVALALWISRRRTWASAATVAFVAASQVYMFGLMIARHRPVYEFHDHHLWYYPLLFQVVIVVGLLFALEGLTPRLSAAGLWVLRGVLLALVVSNVWHWPRYRAAMEPWFPHVYEQSELLKQSLKEGRPQPGLMADERSFFDALAGRRR